MAPARGGGPHSDAGELALAQMTGSRDGPKRERNGQRRRKRGIMLLAVFLFVVIMEKLLEVMDMAAFSVRFSYSLERRGFVALPHRAHISYHRMVVDINFNSCIEQ